MKTFRLILLGAVFFELLLSSTLHAQYYGNRRYFNRRGYPMQPQMYPTNMAPVQPVQPQPQPQPQAEPAPAPLIPATNVTARPQQVVRVVPVDPEKARIAKEETVRKTVEFQKKKAEAGSESAQYELGMRYLKGDGVDKDEDAARKWLTLSAKNGYSPATKKLAELDRAALASKEEPPKADK